MTVTWRVGRRWIHRYAEALVSYQNGRGTERISDLVDAEDSPGVIVIYEDLKDRNISLTDSGKAELLRSSGHDKLHFGDNFSVLAAPNGPSQLLFSECLHLASYHNNLDVVSQILLLAFTTFKDHTSPRNILQQGLKQCERMGRDSSLRTMEPWVYATRWLEQAADHLRVDHTTIRSYLAAAGTSQDAVIIQDAIDKLSNLPQVGGLLRRSSHYYGSCLKAYSYLPSPSVYDYVEGVFSEMESHGIEPTLEHYEMFLRICTKNGDLHRAESVLESALQVDQASKDEVNRFEAALISFYSSFNRHEDVQCGIERADSDGKLQEVPEIAKATLEHFLKQSREGKVLPCSPDLLVSLEHSYRRKKEVWKELRYLFLELYISIGLVPQAEVIFDDFYVERLCTFEPGYPASNTLRLMHAQLYESAFKRSEYENAGHVDSPS
eukprot:TRINITY_DN8189_c2_g1_i1.p1 TRINITY_DN8189_c2_g1~~TRINITY_DN8189_c2_g1_i1.p1  ORF type:complete len:437 (+),score=73.84 TRINITY_DN8189_c2_g1_i1:48-1358(+)